MENSEFSVIDFVGNSVSGNPKPSSEKFLHLEFYKKRPDINYILQISFLKKIVDDLNIIEEIDNVKFKEYTKEILKNYNLNSDEDLQNNAQNYLNAFHLKRMFDPHWNLYTDNYCFHFRLEDARSSYSIYTEAHFRFDKLRKYYS